MVENCRIFTFPQDFVFSFSSKAEPGFPDAHGARHPRAFVLFHKVCFGRFVRGLGEDPHPPRWSEVQGVPCFSTK